MSPEELVQMLNRIFSQFDTIAGAHGLERIKTIGDAYMLGSSGKPSATNRRRSPMLHCDDGCDSGHFCGIRLRPQVPHWHS